MATSYATKTKKEMEQLIDLFLSPSFNIGDADYSIDNHKKVTSRKDMQFECEGNDENAEVADCGEDKDSTDAASADSTGYQTNDYLKNCGRKLSKMGDDYVKEKYGVHPLELEELKKVMEASAMKKMEEKEAWDKFERVMTASFEDSPANDAFQCLGAFMVTLKGFSMMGEGVRILARKFSLKYIEERELDKTIEKMGGMAALMQQQVD